MLSSGMRGAYLLDCGPFEPLTKAARDVDGQLRKKLWATTEQQLDAALLALNIK